MEIESGGGIVEVDLVDATDTTVSVTETEDDIRVGFNCREPHVEVHLSAPLDPSQARELAQELLDAADRAERDEG